MGTHGGEANDLRMVEKLMTYVWLCQKETGVDPSLLP